MSNEEEMDRQIPSFPILFKISTVPPILVKVPITKFDDLGDNIEEKMKECIEAEYPGNCVRN